ncbi:hypothetical protein PybrP1_012221 [[Pythium] brassicae (nom. inval.)]|nr:hypothetical protein PybrP1_012221 [[Pythium] brassicae (nom. inval.)]
MKVAAAVIVFTSATTLLLAPNASAATVTVHHSHHYHQFKETPWERDPDVKKAKCADMCLLQSLWVHQLGRNCFSRSTGLCLNYKLASAGLEAVLAVAECECVAAANTTTTTMTTN